MLNKNCIDNRKKNTKRVITNEIKEIVYERDKVCILCENESIQEIHHCYYGNQAMYGPSRNNPEFLVGLCNICHSILHFEGSNNYRERTIEYLKKYYE